LISKGANVNAKDIYGRTPLHFIGLNICINIGVLLISKGADLNAKGYKGYTPLHNAAWKDFNKIGELLISNGADINAKDNIIIFNQEYSYSRKEFK